MHEEYVLLVNLSLSLVLALVLGLITERLRLSPIVGYLLAGIILGKHTPGYAADPAIAQQLAEIGVALLMFGVGMHFDISDLLAVRKIAIPGAVGQIAVAALLGTLVSLLFGLGLGDGVVIGIAVSVASTVVLVRVLVDNDVLHTSQGHIAVGWLIVEDIFTVLVLVMLPALSSALGEHPVGGGPNLLFSLLWAIAKIVALTLIVVVGGKRVIPWLLRQVARTRSRELFTLTVLALALAIATGSAVIFQVSLALGAFLAGMVVGQTEVSHQAAADALPMRDAFAVLFFVSVGMLFEPGVVLQQPVFLLALLAIVLIAKPLTALAIVWLFRYSLHSALTIAIALAQIGEFSFILAKEAIHHKLLTVQGQSLLVACALISITINPLLFRSIVPLENWLRTKKRLWQALNSRSETSGGEMNAEMYVRATASVEGEDVVKAVVVGFGPVGQTACRVMKEFGIQPIVVDLNLDTIRTLAEAGEIAVYGDATRRDILEAAGIKQAKYLLLTIPEVLVRTVVILAAKDLNPDLRIFVRARYLQERAWLEEVGATKVCTEEGETALGLAVLLLREVGADESRIRLEIRRIQAEFEMGKHPVEETEKPTPGAADVPNMP